MTAFDATKLFQAQLARALTGLSWLKVIILPNPLQEPGCVVSIAVRKPKREQTTKLVQVRTLRILVSISGRIESETGLKMAMDAIEAVSGFLLSATHLEDKDGHPIADARITTTPVDDDGILEDPETGGKAWVREDFPVSINLP